MATNIPAKNFDAIRYALTAAAETAIVLPVNTVRFMKVQCTTAADAYIGFSPGATWSADNFWTVKSADTLVLEDIAMQPRDAVAGGGTIFYMRGSGSLTVEILYAQG